MTREGKHGLQSCAGPRMPENRAGVTEDGFFCTLFRGNDAAESSRSPQFQFFHTLFRGNAAAESSQALAFRLFYTPESGNP